MSSNGMHTVGKNQDQAGLATHFRSDMPGLARVEVVEAMDLTVEEFLVSFVSNNIPVLVKGGLDSKWRCLECWDVDYLSKTVGHSELPIRVNPSSNGVFGDVTRLSENQVSLYDFDILPFRKFLERIGNGDKSFYPARVELCSDLPELVPDIPSFYDIPWRFAFGSPYKNGPTSYFGPGKQTTPLHYDTLENLTFMIKGTKTFKLYPPSLSPSMAPAPRSLGTHYSVLEELPEGVPSLDITLEAGDMLYLPICWWHSVHGGEGFNISLNYWFCQNKEKEDYDAYKTYLCDAFNRTLNQISSMHLPEKVVEEARKDVELNVESKLNHRKQFSWTC